MSWKPLYAAIYLVENRSVVTAGLRQADGTASTMQHHGIDGSPGMLRNTLQLSPAENWQNITGKSEQENRRSNGK